MPRIHSQVEFAKITARLANQKDDIIKRLSGDATLVEISAHYGLSLGTFKDACKVLEIEAGRKSPASHLPPPAHSGHPHRPRKMRQQPASSGPGLPR